MKKTISIVTAAILAAVALPFGVNAANLSIPPDSKLYFLRTAGEITLDEVERIAI